MGKVGIGLNLEAVRTSHKPFEWAVQFAAELGYEYIEPMVHWGRELLSEARYFHSVSMLDDPLRIRRAVEKHGLKLSALSSHSQLSKPEIAVEYLKQAARYAAECGAPVINTHEGHKQAWTTEEEDFVLIRYSIMEAAKVCEPRGIKLGLEMHQTYSLIPDKYDRILNLVTSPSVARTSTRATPISAASTPLPGWSGSSTAWSTCTPRTSASSNRKPSGAR